MKFLSQIGNLLDEIDANPGEAGEDGQPAQPASQAPSVPGDVGFATDASYGSAAPEPQAPGRPGDFGFVTDASYRSAAPEPQAAATGARELLGSTWTEAAAATREALSSAWVEAAPAPLRRAADPAGPGRAPLHEATAAPLAAPVPAQPPRIPTPAAAPPSGARPPSALPAPSAAGGADPATAARLAAAEEERWELLERLRAAEEKVLDSISARDMFARETDMYRSELKVAREDRARLEGDLAKAQEQLREVRATASAPSPAQQAVIQAMQKDFEGRMERYREEAQLLQQKIEEKERRVEQLTCERNALAGELRSATVSQSLAGANAWRAAVAGSGGDTVAAPASAETPGDVEAGGGSSSSTGAAAARPGKAAAGGTARALVRSLPLAAPGWLRSSDEPLRMVVRTLSNYPQARIAFFVYVFLLHVWVLFVLQQSAMQ